MDRQIHLVPVDEQLARPDGTMSAPRWPESSEFGPIPDLHGVVVE